jgi:hypothetical protein
VNWPIRVSLKRVDCPLHLVEIFISTAGPRARRETY